MDDLGHPVGPEDEFRRLVYRTFEDLRRIRIAYAHRIRQAILSAEEKAGSASSPE